MNENTTLNIITVIIILILLALLMGIIMTASKRFRKNYKRNELDEMEGHEFEYFCADLLRKKGFIDVEVTKASGDYGIDILAEKDGVTYGIQCKRYQEPVGIKAIQEAYAGKEYYDRMVGAVMTNQYFTTPAVNTARKLKILLWDRGYIDSMIEEEAI
ncbi:MAG: restriction endonuclease [Lachnospiraceae bacterium]|nr:restriction endonuclease [Lachnospiraceae bacterium]